MPNDSTASTENHLAPLNKGGALPRLAGIAVVILAVAGAFLYLGGWFSPNALTPKRFVDGFERVDGIYSGFRRNHAKGVGVSGYFESNGAGAALSKAVVFRSGRVPVIGRFALAGGQPYQADAAHTVRSMALLFKLPNGEEWRTGINNIPVFPVNSAQGFYDLLLATTPDPSTGKPDPARLAAFFTKYPESAKAMQLIRSNPVSSGFEDSTFNSLNAFRFINDQGVATPVRWSMVPVQPVA